MQGVRRHVQRDALAGQAVECGHASAATFSAFAAFAVLVATPYCARSDWSLGTDAAVRHDDNVGNAQFYSDKAADSTLDARLSMFRLFTLGESYSATIGGELGGEVYRQLTGLNNASLDATVALKKKWGLGAFAPWARAGLSVARFGYEDGYRNAWDYRATLGAGQRISERWNVWADYAYESRVATPQPEEVPGLSGDAYSQVSQSVAAHVEFSLTESAYLSMGLLRRHGDVVSTSTPNTAVFYSSRALAEDPTFGPNAYAYKLTGNTLGLRLGVNYAWGAHTLLGCGFDRLDTHSDGGNGYTRSIAELTWDYRF